MSRATILFGAGAENCFGICDGSKFAHKVVGIDASEMNKAIYEFYKKKIKLLTGELKDWYPYLFKEVSRNDENLRKRFWEACIRKKLLDTKEILNMKKDYDKEVEEMLKALESDENEAERKKIENEYTSYMGIIDENFHTLIAPRVLGPQKFCSVLAYYTRAYLEIVRGLLQGNDEMEYYKQILENPDGIVKKIEKSLSTDQRFHQNCSYYSILKKYNNHCKVITTNYTPICEEITDVDKDDIAYVHGKIGWFESAYRRKVYDVNHCDEKLPDDDLLFPYLFIQSGIKPVIEEKQIKEYGKAIQFLEDTERIIVVGYRINADDNHLNAMLSSAIRRKNKTFCYLDFDDKSEDEILHRLHIDRNEIECFSYKKINRENCFDVFEEVIKDIN